MNTVKREVNWYCQREFEVCRWDNYDYTWLSHITAGQRRGKYKKQIAECFCMLDTETSKSSADSYTMKCIEGRAMRNYAQNLNYVVKWSLAINYYGINVCVLWGSLPTDCVRCLDKLSGVLPGNCKIVYIQNLAYDWLFLRKFLIQAWGEPEEQLNTKPHYPIMIGFGNGIQLRDSLILSQRSIEKWGKDLNVLHQKAVGKWDYNRIRHQADGLTDDELLYICNDVICGVECLDVQRRILHKTHAGMPYTATGIPRGEARKIGEQYKAHDDYIKRMGDFDWYIAAEKCYHGGYTHANRHHVAWVESNVQAYDFASSYPYTMLSEKFPCTRFTEIPADKITLEDVLNTDYCCMVEFWARGIHLKSWDEPMPNLQVSKCEYILDPIVDNGRVLKAEFASIYLTEVDLQIIADQYDFDETKIYRCWIAKKDYLPRWLTDYVYKLFCEKTQLKGVDQIQYNIAKAKLNSIYGMCVQKVCRDEITEVYETGEYIINRMLTEDEYEKVKKRRTSFLPYSIGVYVTAYAMRNLYHLGRCAGTWLYSDTDSAYGQEWDMDRIRQYNEYCKKLLAARGYPGVEHNGRDYWLGVAELDGSYLEFVTLGAKRYACRDADTGELKITVAGVPKKAGVKCLNNDIANFKNGLLFVGETTGKLTHVYNYIDDIIVNEFGDEIGDSINLIPCDYLLDNARIDDIFVNEVVIPTYGAED